MQRSQMSELCKGLSISCSLEMTVMGLDRTAKSLPFVKGGQEGFECIVCV